MSPALEPMSFDELSELYRVEMKSSAITQVRKDLFRAMANLLTALRLEYDRQHPSAWSTTARWPSTPNR